MFTSPTCSKNTAHRTVRSYLAGAVAAILACLCCSLPLIPLMLGLSASSSLLGLNKYHAVFDVLGAVILFASLVYIWRRHKGAEIPFFRNKQFWACAVMSFLMYGGMSYVIKSEVAPRLLGSQATVHGEHIDKK